MNGLIYCPICDDGFLVSEEEKRAECHRICGNRIKGCKYKIGDILKVRIVEREIRKDNLFAVVVALKVLKNTTNGKTKREVIIGIRYITLVEVRAVQNRVISLRPKVGTEPKPKIDDWISKTDRRSTFSKMYMRRG